MRDFKSTLRVEDYETGAQFVGVAHMNNPVYFERRTSWFWPNEDWKFFQSGWNPQAGEQLTILGVGNRAGGTTMLVGSVMIGVGLLYAFYVKPVIIQRMKQKAIRQASAKKEQRKPRAREEEREREAVMSS
jgi:hypothetical protein